MKHYPLTIHQHLYCLSTPALNEKQYVGEWIEPVTLFCRIKTQKMSGNVDFVWNIYSSKLKHLTDFQVFSMPSLESFIGNNNKMFDYFWFLNILSNKIILIGWPWEKSHQIRVCCLICVTCVSLTWKSLTSRGQAFVWVITFSRRRMWPQPETSNLKLELVSRLQF